MHILKVIQPHMIYSVHFLATFSHTYVWLSNNSHCNIWMKLYVLPRCLILPSLKALRTHHCIRVHNYFFNLFTSSCTITSHSHTQRFNLFSSNFRSFLSLEETARKLHFRKEVVAIRQSKEQREIFSKISAALTHGWPLLHCNSFILCKPKQRIGVAFHLYFAVIRTG